MDSWARQLAEQNVYPVRLLGPGGELLYANSAWERMVAPASPDSPLAGLSQLVAEPDRRRLAAHITCPPGDGHPRTSNRVWVRLASTEDADSSLWWAVGCIPVVGPSDEFHGCISMLIPGEMADGAVDAWQQSEELARTETPLNSGAWEWDVATGALWWSEEVYLVFGMTGEHAREISFDAFLAAVHPEDRDSVAAEVARSMRTGARYDVRHRIVRPSGEVRYVRDRGSVTRDAAGRPIHMLGTVVDVTDQTLTEFARAQAAQALVASEGRYRLLAENASDVVWQVSTEGIIAWVSESITGILGWTPGEVIGRHVRDYLHSEDLQREGLLHE